MKTDYQARGVLYLPEAARFATLLKLPEGANIGKAINDAMRAIEADNVELKDVLPRSYNALDNTTLVTLLKTFASIPMDLEGDAFGRIYEYFLGKFAMSEGQKGGEFFTPTSLVKLIVEIIEPFHGRIFDPACGSGGMFVQSARFVENHQALTPGPSPRKNVARLLEATRRSVTNRDRINLRSQIATSRFSSREAKRCYRNMLWLRLNRSSERRSGETSSGLPKISASNSRLRTKT